jgi:hypothetical protein
MHRLESRLRKLEEQIESREEPECTGLASVWHRISIERRKNLAPGERIVVDWYRDRNSLTIGRERITDEPEDLGRRCKAGGYLLDVLEQIHQSCAQRGPFGSCAVCRNTPVAEAGPSHPSASPEEVTPP